MQYQAALARKALGILLVSGFNPLGHAVTDGDDMNLHKRLNRQGAKSAKDKN
jgi:hypothetical protein